MEVVAGVRRPESLRRRFPGLRVIACDFNHDTDPALWRPRLAGITAVVNAAGVLRGGRGQDIEAIHVGTPAALFEACRQVGVRRVIQISALGADAAAGTAYADSKRRAEGLLAAQEDLDWVILRPSLVYAAGSYGGTSLFRALAALPGMIPLPGGGESPFQPIYMEDLTLAVRRLIETPQHPSHVTLDAAGPERLRLRDIIVRYRAWLGLAPAPVLALPWPLMLALGRIGGMLGRGPISRTALQQLRHGSAADPEPFQTALGLTLRSFDSVLRDHPAQTQDLWQARLYGLRPVVRAVLVLLWTVSGLLALLGERALDQGEAVLGALGLPLGWLQAGLTEAVVYATGLLDLAIAAALTVQWAPRWMGRVQLAVVLGYSLVLSFAQPSLWAEPLGPLLKNLPILVLILVAMVLDKER